MHPDKLIPGSMFNFDGINYVVGNENELLKLVELDTSSLYPSIFSASNEESRLPFDNNYLYRNVFMNLCDENEDKKAEYETLLKLNDNDYQRTVLQIEYNNGLAIDTNNILNSYRNLL